MSRTWLGPVVILGMAAFALAAMPFLPDRVPAHWPLTGEVERWAERWIGALRLPAWALVTWSVIRVIPGLQPRETSRFHDIYWSAINLVMLGFALVHLLRLGTALGWVLGPDRALLLGIGLLLLALADQARGLKPDSLVGVRTPWALRDDRIWDETHRLAAMTFLAGGALTLLAVFLPPELRPWAALLVLLFGGFTPVLYSYLLGREGERPRPPTRAGAGDRTRNGHGR